MVHRLCHADCVTQFGGYFTLGVFGALGEKTYHHYHDRLGHELKSTRQTLEKIRPEAEPWDHVSWGRLLFANLPKTCSKIGAKIQLARSEKTGNPDSMKASNTFWEILAASVAVMIVWATPMDGMEVKSPDSRVVVTLKVKELEGATGCAVFSVSYRGKLVVASSRMTSRVTSDERDWAGTSERFRRFCGLSSARIAASRC